MKWQHVQENWSAFYDAITERWPAADETELDEIDGDQRAFIAYIAGLEEQETAEAREDIRDWLTGELPSDVVMDPRHDNQSIANSAKYLGEGEDEFDDDAKFGDDAEA
jgi:hypothetical protein